MFGGTVFDDFGVLGDHCGINLVIIWWQGSLRRALECPEVDFWWFLMTFGYPIGNMFRLLFRMLCDLRCQKACLDCRHDHWWFMIGKIDDFWCPNLLVYMVNICVFIRFNFFVVFHQFNDFRYPFGPHFGHFLWYIILEICSCIGYSLTFHWFSVDRRLII